jgi:hypothetical protein
MAGSKEYPNLMLGNREWFVANPEMTPFWSYFRVDGHTATAQKRVVIEAR